MTATYPTSTEETHLISCLNLYLNFVISERKSYIHKHMHTYINYSAWGGGDEEDDDNDDDDFSRYNREYL